jgi:hypothetical protein
MILRFCRLTAVLLISPLLIGAQQPPAPAPPPPPPTAGQPAQSGDLKIVVVQGEGVRNNIRAKSATAPVVEVRDPSDKPVAGAEVVFQLPATGPGGVFHGWMRTQTVRTNEQGQAVASGYTPNDEEGRFNIRVTASTRTQNGSVVISQVNARNGPGSSAPSSRSGWWKVAAIAGAAALGGGIYAAVSGDETTTVAQRNPVIITAGPVTIGGPR